ncbi:MAG: DUF2961 domain-containing protein [Oscillospiraceae bacterium]|nr:DUF2961 domain-containing protein [Oscillospiraceae bacterium]
MLKHLSHITDGITHLITAENVYGKKGVGGMAEIGKLQDDVAKLGQPACTGDMETHAARELGTGWKVRPCIQIPKATTVPILDLTMSGCITHIWVTMDEQPLQDLIFRFYWDEETEPSVEVPAGDFFCLPFRKSLKITSIPITVNPQRGCNCYMPMPFRKHARITVENRNPQKEHTLFYAISVEERDIAPEEAYFHAQFRRQNPTTGDDYVIVDGIKGRGQYIGTAIGWQQNTEGWWGEGEVKMFMDGDTDYATYVGTGTEDYFCGAWGFFDNFSAPFSGYQDTTALLEKRETNRVGNRHAMYRFHVTDPIRFREDLKVTIQVLGWRSESRFLPLKDDLNSVAYWYQTEPHAKFPAFPTRDEMEVI